MAVELSSYFQETHSPFNLRLRAQSRAKHCVDAETIAMVQLHLTLCCFDITLLCVLFIIETNGKPPLLTLTDLQVISRPQYLDIDIGTVTSGHLKHCWGSCYVIFLTWLEWTIWQMSIIDWLIYWFMHRRHVIMSDCQSPYNTIIGSISQIAL